MWQSWCNTVNVTEHHRKVLTFMTHKVEVNNHGEVSSALDIIRISWSVKGFQMQPLSSSLMMSIGCISGSTAVVRAAVKARPASIPVMKAGKQMMSRVIGLLSQTLCMVCQVPQVPHGRGTLPTVSPGGMTSLACPSQQRYTAGAADVNVVVEEDEIVCPVFGGKGAILHVSKNKLFRCCMATCRKTLKL